LLAGAPLAHAGGHFDVDDAATLSAGECQVELWGEYVRQKRIDLYHVGPACGVGQVEVGLNWEFTQTDQVSHLIGPQLKWTFFGRESDAKLSAAIVAGAQYDARNGGRWGGQSLVVLSWQALEPLQFNANLGKDWTPGDGDRYARNGVQVQWAATADLTLVAERFHSFSQWGSRLGLNWQLNPRSSIDFSVARRGFDGGETVYTVGLNQMFDFLDKPASR